MRILSKDLVKALKNLKLEYHRPPVLNYIYMRAKNENLLFYATNLEDIYYSNVSISSKEEFEILIPGAKRKKIGKVRKKARLRTVHPFIDFVNVSSKMFEAFEIELNKEESVESLIVKSYESKYDLDYFSKTIFYCNMPVEEFPAIKEGQ